MSHDELARDLDLPVSGGLCDGWIGRLEEACAEGPRMLDALRAIDDGE